VEKLLGRRLPVLVLAPTWPSRAGAKSTDLNAIFHGVTRETLRDLVLLPWIRSRRWFAAKPRRSRTRASRAVDEWKTSEGDWWLAFIEVELESGEVQRYFVPLALAWNRASSTRWRNTASSA